MILRCETCGNLVGDKQLKDHGGHRLRTACKVSLWEWILVKLGVIR